MRKDQSTGRAARPNRRQALGLTLATVALGATLSGCGGGDEDDDGNARLRLVNATLGYDSLDLYVDDRKRASAVTQGSVSGYAAVESGESLGTRITQADASSALVTPSYTLGKNTHQTVVAYGWAGALATTLVAENVAAAASGRAKLRVMNLGSDAGAVDVYLTGTAETLDAAVPLASNVAAGATVEALSLSAGSYRLWITGTGDKTDVRLDVAGFSLTSTQVASLLLTPATSGVLVNALLLVQQGTATALNNTQARARVVASVSGNGRVTAALGGTPLSGLTSPSVGSYARVPSGAGLSLGVSVNGLALADSSRAILAGGDYTVLVWGDAAAPQVALLRDDNRLPTGTTLSRLRLVNGLNADAGALDLEADNAPVASAVVAGQASDYRTVTSSSTMWLDVVSPLSATPLYRTTEAKIEAKGVYSVYLLNGGSAPLGVLRRER